MFTHKTPPFPHPFHPISWVEHVKQSRAPKMALLKVQQLNVTSGNDGGGGALNGLTRFTGAFLDLDDSWQPLLQSLTAHRLQLTHIVIGPAIAAAHLVAELALAYPFAEALAHGVLAIQAVPAWWVFLAATGITFSRSTDKAAVATIGDIAAWAAGARALGDIATSWTFAIGHKGLCKGPART